MNGKKSTRYIPMEVNPDTIKDFGIHQNDIVWAKIGNKRVQAVMIPATEEQYQEYMRPLWREDKRSQRHTPEESYENIEARYDSTSTTIEENFLEKTLIEELRKALRELNDVDRTIMEMYSHGYSESKIGQVIGMSQRGVGKRKQKILNWLHKRLKDY